MTEDTKDHVYPRGVEVIVGPFIINDKRQVLLFTSPKWDGVWIVPGGHIEPGETLEEALIRETFEEIGVEIEPLDLISVADGIVSPPQFKRNAHFVFINYAAKLKSDKFVFNREISAFKWFDIDEAIGSDMVREGCREAAKKLKIWMELNNL